MLIKIHPDWWFTQMVWYSKFMTSWGLSSRRDFDRPREALEMPMRSWVRKIWSWVERFGGFLDISCWFLLILGLFIYIYNYIYIYITQLCMLGHFLPEVWCFATRFLLQKNYAIWDWADLFSILMIYGKLQFNAIVHCLVRAVPHEPYSNGMLPFIGLTNTHFL